MMISPHYQRGAQFVLAVDMVYPWATFPLMNTYDLFEKGSTENYWWIGVVACIDIAWTLAAILGLIFSCCCLRIPRRVDLLLKAWFFSSTFGVLIHFFCTFMNSQWVIFIFSVILRLPYFYMVLLYWNDIRNSFQGSMHVTT